MKKKCRIVIAEDHTILREGLCALLNAHEEFEVIGEAKDGLEAISCVERLQPDLLLVDLSMPKMSGISAISQIRKQFSEIKIIVLTVHDTEEYLRAALNAGANGYILKDASHNELVVAIKNVLDGKPFLSPGVSESVIQGYLKGNKKTQPLSAWDRVSPREREVLKLIAEGYQNKAIAEYLYLSIKTVEKHRGNLMKKLDLHNVAELTAYAIKRGLTG
jgi:DNA-binding NarL/FixJ family response regulator